MRMLGLVAPVLVVAACHSAPPRTVRANDLDAWKGAPVIELETHPVYSVRRKTAKTLSDGSSLWSYDNCTEHREDTRCVGSRYGNVSTLNCGGGEDYTTCCYSQFLVRDNKVEWYRVQGDGCFTDCTGRPPSHPCSPDEQTKAN